MKKIPLTWLQAFEAAGRCGSFKAAAQELNVSPSNVSHQIRNLESYFGTPLFSRNGRQVQLTEEGRNYLADLTPGFEAIRQASFGTANPSAVLQIGAFPFLSNEVIAPNVSELKEVLPDIDVRLFTSTELTALTDVSSANRLDLIVRYGPANGRISGFVTQKIGDLALVPVIGRNQPEVDDVETLLDQPLIRVIGPFQGWERWQAHYAPGAPTQECALEIDSFHAAMLSVERGDGVCLAVLPFLNPWIRTGRVRALLDFTLPVPDQAAFVVCAPHNEHNPQIAKFSRWLGQHLE